MNANRNISGLEKTDRETQKVIQSHCLMHRQSDITRLYIPPKSRGRGLLSTVNQFKNSTSYFNVYLCNTNEHLLQAVSNWELGRLKINPQHGTYVLP